MTKTKGPPLAITPEIEELAARGAWFAFSVSGGKDSGAAMHAGSAWLDSVGHPRDRRLGLHADLGRAEWPDTIDVVRAVGARVGMPVEVVSHREDLVWRFEDRWRRSLDRYRALETINLVPPWSSSSLLFCRGEFKSQVLSRRKARLDGGLPVVGVIGIRRQESSRRASAPIASPDGDMIRRNGRAGVLWNPIVDWTTDEVFAYHAAHGIPLHRAYQTCTRLSCAFCVLGSKNDLQASLAAGNEDLWRSYVSLEMRSAFPFQTAAWLAALRPDDPVASRLAEARRMADERVRLQAAIPRELLRRKTIINIDVEEATALAAARRGIGGIYGIDVAGTTAAAVMEIAAARREKA